MNSESSRSHAIFTVRIEVSCSQMLDHQFLMEASSMPNSAVPPPPPMVGGIGGDEGSSSPLELSDASAMDSTLKASAHTQGGVPRQSLPPRSQ